MKKNEQNFLIEEDSYVYEFEFNLEDHKYRAINLLEVDPNLTIVREGLVPKQISEETFWRNYFYQIEVIKLKYGFENKLRIPGDIEFA